MSHTKCQYCERNTEISATDLLDLPHLVIIDDGFSIKVEDCVSGEHAHKYAQSLISNTNIKSITVVCRIRKLERPGFKLQNDQIPGPCSYCGDPNHWRPDCPRIAEDNKLKIVPK